MLNFKLKILVQSSIFLDLKLQGLARVFLYQRKYILDILADSVFSDSHPLTIPLEQNLKLDNITGNLLKDSSSHRILVWHLLYLTISLPDMFYATQILSQYLDKLRKPHLQAIHCVLRYLKATLG